MSLTGIIFQKDSLVLTLTENSVHFECKHPTDPAVKYEFDLQLHKTVDKEVTVTPIIYSSPLMCYNNAVKSTVLIKVGI